MIRLEDLLRLHCIERVELMSWIEAEWVRPQPTGSDWIFDGLDEARVELIRELHHELLVGEEAMPVVLNLLDQLYATRRVLAEINEAIRDLPEPLRDELRRHLKSAIAKGNDEPNG